MAHYIDGFVFPISSDRIDEYKSVATAVAAIYIEHGAIDYLEFVGDDLSRGGTAHFPDLIHSTSNETVVFGWIVFESREARDVVNERVEADPRMAELVAPLLNPTDPVFVPTRMAYGGFKPLIGTANRVAGQ